ncbi:hypothetical protein PV04_03309 [Phialophora macrospora]|uniref:Uncharacterized protein n=1 Tax=Phialophora macrospora TaxID=1851006 RepID=A0A0D2GFX0_9EURO|nr:hypothetical protein PV04_03309 [Phialophora macrospora]
MAARSASPTHAFDPTPALEHNPDNYSPLTRPPVMGSSFDFKGVRFSDPPAFPMQARHSIATDVPLLPPIPSASQLPKHSFQGATSAPVVDITAYMEQCRLLNTQLRQSHESERKTWDIERSALKARIAELEQKLSRTRELNRRSSNDSSVGSLHSFRSNSVPIAANGKLRQRISPDRAFSEPPVWIGPETTPPVTRVFSHEEDVNHLPSISEDEALPALSKETSPSSSAQENVPVPIEQVDKTLDGITLKSAALTSSFDKEITSPQFASPARSPSPLPRKEDSLKVDVGTLLSPLDEKLRRHAGHTPMVFDGTISSDSASTALTPRQEMPVAPAPTKRPPIRPSENSDSYFSFSSPRGDNRKENQPEELQPVHETQDDPALKGPLMLDPHAKTVESATFLNSLDARLIEEKKQQERTESKLAGANEEPESHDQHAGSSTTDDEMPRLRMKNSMNFGSAWGGQDPGRMI